MDEDPGAGTAMTWNNRIIRRTKRYKKKTLHFYDVREVHYNKNGKPISWMQDPLNLDGYESIHDLRASIARIVYDVVRTPIMEEKKKGKKTVLVERK